MIFSKVHGVPERVDQFDVDSVQRSLGHVHGIVDSIGGVEKHLGVVGLDRDLLNNRVVAEVRSDVVVREARADYVQVSSGVQIYMRYVWLV